MKCPNCSAEIADDSLECEFCGHSMSSAAQVVTQDAIPSTPLSSNSVPEPPSIEMSAPLPPAPPSDNPYVNHSSAPSSSNYTRAAVPNYLVWAIASTVCCCWPLGIVAIVYAAQVDSKLASGDYDGAVASSNNAKLWSMISLGAALLGGVAYFMLAMLGALAGA